MVLEGCRRWVALKAKGMAKGSRVVAEMGEKNAIPRPPTAKRSTVDAFCCHTTGRSLSLLDMFSRLQMSSSVRKAVPTA